MTVLRREVGQAGVANPGAEIPVASVFPPVLQIVPVSIRRLRGSVGSCRRLSQCSGPVCALGGRGCLFSLQYGPNEAEQFARHRDGHLRSLFMEREPAESPAQPLLRFVRDRDHRGRLPRASPLEGQADTGTMLVVPRRLDHEPADQGIAGAGNPSPRDLVAARMLARHEADVGHQRAGCGKPSEVVQFREQRDGGQRVNAAEAP